MIKLAPSLTACAALILLCVGVTPQANAALMYSNLTLPGGSPGFDLIGKQPGPPSVGISPGPPQEFLVGFNSTQIQPGPPNVPTLDLANAGSPLLNNPSTGSAFSIFWGMYPPDPGMPAGSTNPGPPNIQFNLPMNPTGGFKPPSPNADGSFSYSFGATDGTNNFDIFFLITGSTAMDTASWVMTKAGPPVLPAVQFNFSFLSPGDPTLSFTVYENGQQLNFSPAVPEPETYAMLLAGLGLLGFAARRRRQAS